MKFDKIFCAAALAGVGCVAVHGELQPWLQWLPAGSLQAVFFRPVSMPGGVVDSRRPPAETRPALTERIAAAPRDVQLYRFRAREDELQLDFAAAEADWVQYARMTGANLELADFYHRRLRPKEELAALESVTHTPSERWTPVTQQTAWRAFERMLPLTEDQAPVFQEWIARYPREPQVRQLFIGCLVRQKLYLEAAAQIGDYERFYPDDVSYPVSARASLEVSRGVVDQAIAVYDRAFQPLWPDDVMAAYFKLLDDQGRLREFLGRNRAALAANAQDLGAAARLFAYYQHQQNAAAAGRVLIEFRLNKESRHLAWTATELSTLAKLFEKAGDTNEAARCYYALYSLPGADAASTENAIAGLTGLLVNPSDQQVRFGSGNLSFYKDIATMDSTPGFLNGILSLLLNGTGPRWKYQEQDQKAVMYFHRASAAELLAMLDQRFPQSLSRDPLHAALIEAYAQYGDNEAVIRAGREFLIAFPNSARRLAVAMLVADALARLNRTKEEYALYDQLLTELAAKADGVPLGRMQAAREPEYQQVLDRYISRLTANHGSADVLKLYRREIDRNPNDAGLYERLAGFLEDDHMFGDVDQVYRLAIQKLNDSGWYTSLARFYIRRKEIVAMTGLTREVTGIFSGSELDAYFRDAVASAPLDAVLYRQVNLYAHERFPDDLVFVRNLLNAYQRKETRDLAAYTMLLRNYWFYDAWLKGEFFAQLSRQNQLTAEMDAVRKDASNPAARMFLAEGEAWQSHFETAAPMFNAMAGDFPGDKALNERASSVYRSLEQTAVAVKLQENVVAADPRDRDALARVGDIYADHEQFAEAKPYWDRMAALEPRNSAGFLEAATVFWDYYLFNDALRLIDQARGNLHDPTLFAYQAGAIDEGKREYEPAVREYVKGALAGDPDAEKRLVRLSRRPALRAVIDSAIAPSVTLRIAVLNAQGRRADLETLLAGVAASSRDLTVLTQVDEEARKQGFDNVVESAMEREIEISGDPLEKMQLRIALARYFESKSNLKAARATIEALYHDNPKTLGVVRATVDFYERVKEPKQAVATLLSAAKSANPDLQRQFTMEAARKAEESGDYEQSRSILAEVLKGDPNAADALALMAATYSATGDDAGLKEFTLQAIASLKHAALTGDERASRIAALRQGLIPALTRLGEFSGAVEQYIEVIDAYPEDAGVTDTASSYALQHGKAQQLLDFYRKTIVDAPRDYRWPIVLARIETDAEDFPAAIADYTKALADRPDRRDVLEARARLEERLMRFTDAEASYRHLYELSYRDPQWMLKAAEICAREGKTQQAVTAVHQAIVGSGTERAEDLFAIAAQLEQWEMIPRAADFVERGARMAGNSIWEDDTRLVGYFELETRMRRYEEAYQRVANLPPGAQAIGRMTARYFTPEEKSTLAAFLEKRHAAHGEEEFQRLLVPIAEAAGLQDLRVEWMFQRDDPQLIDLQTRRARFEELGAQMELLAKSHQPEDVDLFHAANAYRLAGDDAAELRVLAEGQKQFGLAGDPFERYLALLYKTTPDVIVDLARQRSTVNSYSAADFAESRGDAAFALRAVSARGQTLTPVWNKAYTALTGLYYLQGTPAINQAFVSALGDGTIGERIGKPVDRDQQMAGNVWFYYGARYGEYLATLHRPASEDFLAATTEEAPGKANAYYRLGGYYQETGQRARAIAQFEMVLQLHPDAADADNGIAECLWDSGRRADAIARWRKALATMQRVQSRGVAVPADFWTVVTGIINDIGKHKVLTQLQPDISRLLRDYINRNKSYQLEPLLAAALQASVDSGKDIRWVIDVALESDNSEEALFAFQRDPRLTAAEHETVARELVAVAERHVAAAHGEEVAGAIADRDQQRLQLVGLLLDQKKTAAAQAEWARLPVDAQRAAAPTEIRLAAQSGTVPQLIARYRQQPEYAPPLQAILQAVAALKDPDEKPATLSLLDFGYTRELDAHRYDQSTFLGLARVRVEQGNTDAAVALLHRMNLIVGEPFETFIPAADLLIELGKKEEAIPFLKARERSTPWDAETKLRLGEFARLVANNQVPYALRVKAAESIGKPIKSGSGELDAIASGHLTPAAVEHPYYVPARVLAAPRTTDPPVKLRLLQDALAIDPESVDIRRSLGKTAISQTRYRLGVSVLEPMLSLPDHLEVAMELSAAEERLGEPERALQFAQTALQSDPNEAQRKRLEATSARLQIVVNLDAANQARRPVIHAALEQDRPVRPRRNQ